MIFKQVLTFYFAQKVISIQIFDADDDAAYDADDADVGVVCSVRNASILIECTGSAKWGGNSDEEENDAIMINTTNIL